MTDCLIIEPRTRGNMSTEFDVYLTAKNLFNEEYFEEALRLCNYGLTDQPQHGRMWELKGLIHRVLHQADECLHALRQASEQVTLQPVARCAAADCTAFFGNTVAARQAYLAVFDDPLAGPHVLRGVAEGLVSINEWGLAKSVCQEWCRELPHDSQAWYLLAFASVHSGDEPDDVMEAAREVLHLSDEDVGLRVSIALLLKEVDRMEEAYAAVACLSRYDVALIRCRCALTDLSLIYQHAGDDERHAWCRQVLAT